MKDLKEFLGPIQTPEMRVKVIENSGETVQTFTAPPGFQLERYVDSLHPENELMVYQISRLTFKGELRIETNISVLENHGVECVYLGEQVYEKVQI